MVDVIIDGEVAYCLPDCTCCTACHKLIDEVDECPFQQFKQGVKDCVDLKKGFKWWQSKRSKHERHTFHPPQVGEADLRRKEDRRVEKKRSRLHNMFEANQKTSVKK